MPHPRAVWLVRHGQADWNLQRRYMSDSDRSLTPFGERQARALAAFFAARKVDAIVHTGLARTERTAQAIAGVRPIMLACDRRWREAAHGAWEGLTYFEAIRFLTALPLPFMPPMTGDNYEKTIARTMAWFPAVGLLIGALACVAGLTGDTYGAVSEIGEVIVLAAVTATI
jgi:broad specificity phosphatase PhoE